MRDRKTPRAPQAPISIYSTPQSSLTAADDDDDDKHDHLFRIHLIGNSKTGKSCISEQFLRGTFDEHYNETIGARLGTKIVRVNGKKIKLQILDGTIANVNQFGPIDATVIVVDITNRETLGAAKRQCATLQGEVPNATIFLFANKSDIVQQTRVITKKEIEDFGQEFALGGTFLVSAKNSLGLKDAFTAIATNLSKAVASSKIQQNTIFISRIEKRIHELLKECSASCFFIPHKARKKHKIEALTQLKKLLADDHETPSATHVQTIRNEYPDVDAGIFSRRTKNLLNSIAGIATEKMPAKTNTDSKGQDSAHLASKTL